MKKDIRLLIESIFDGVNLGLKDEYDMTDKIVDCVDLCLPSGTLWCRCNVGAKTETDYGDYYLWGETNNHVIEELSNGEYVKYNSKDELTLLLLEDDIAYQTSNGLYRMPTAEQIEELVNNTDHEWIDGFNDSDVNGYVFRSKVNNNYIFIPAAGVKNTDGKIKYKNMYGDIWSSCLYTPEPICALNLTITSANIYENNFGIRELGYTIRGVLNEK